MARYRVANGGHSWPSGGPSGFGLEPPTNQELSVPDVIASMIDALP